MKMDAGVALALRTRYRGVLIESTLICFETIGRYSRKYLVENSR